MAISLTQPSDIIYNSTSFLLSEQRRLTKYAFHFTDVNNAASILNMGKILSRNKAKNQNLMINDNAASNVIDGTDEEVHDYVRFYFRPKTPTQFHNEGIRSKSELHHELNAHCPVPVFFLFDINKILLRDNAYFTHESLASHYYVDKYQYIQSSQSLINAPFQHIYHYNSLHSEINKQEIIKRRHAEILVQAECDLSDLKFIICRNRYELNTLKALLDPAVLKRYQDKIKIPRNPLSLFNNNHLRIESVVFDKNKHLYIKWIGTKIFCNFKFNLNIFTIDLKNRLTYASVEDYSPFLKNRDNQYWLTGEHLSDYNQCAVQIHLDDHLIYQDIHRL